MVRPETLFWIVFRICKVLPFFFSSGYSRLIGFVGAADGCDSLGLGLDSNYFPRWAELVLPFEALPLGVANIVCRAGWLSPSYCRFIVGFRFSTPVSTAFGVLTRSDSQNSPLSFFISFASSLLSLGALIWALGL